MHGVVEAGKMQDFVRKPVIVATFVATGYDQEVIKWVMNSWEQFDLDFDIRWHLLVPTTEWIEGGGNADWSNVRFNARLAKQFAGIYGLDRKRLPAIVFENYNDEEQQEMVSVRNAKEPHLRAFFETCEEVMAQNPYKGEQIGLYRRQVIGSIKNTVAAKDVGGLVMEKTPIIGSIIRLAKTLGGVG